MTSWIVSVCGIALLSVLVDVILPDGKTQKYVQNQVKNQSIKTESKMAQMFDMAGMLQILSSLCLGVSHEFWIQVSFFL